MEDDGYQAADQHDQVQTEVRAAGLQGLAVQRLGPAAETRCQDFRVREKHAADGCGEQGDSIKEAKQVVCIDALTGELEERGVVAVHVADQSPAAVQPEGQPQEN